MNSLKHWDIELLQIIKTSEQSETNEALELRYYEVSCFEWYIIHRIQYCTGTNMTTEHWESSIPIYTYLCQQQN